MADFGSVGTVAVIDKAPAVGPVKHMRVSIVGDAAYVTGGSTSFLKKLRTLLGENVNVLHLATSGSSLDSTTAESLEYTPRGAPLDCTVVASSDLFTSRDSAGDPVAHGLVAGQAVRFFKKQPHNANHPDPVMPAGVSEDTIYYVIASGLTSSAFKVSATSGGSTIAVTDAGLGDFQVVSEDMLLIRQDSDGAESADGNQSDMTYHAYVVAY